MASAVLALSARPTSVPAARQLVRERCLAWGADATAGEAAVLLTSELVTNAVLHARTPLTLSVTHTEEVLRVEVRDSHAAMPQPRRYNLDMTTGRGLRLLEALASAWGVFRVPHSERPGKIVWFELSLQTDPSLDDTHLAAAYRDVLEIGWLDELDVS